MYCIIVKFVKAHSEKDQTSKQPAWLHGSRQRHWEKKASNSLQLPGFQSRQLIGYPQHLLPSTADWLVETKKRISKLIG